MSHKSAKRRKHGGHEEEHENHERWLVTYADMLTLLMVLFIVMFAMSTIDKAKFAALADGLADGFGAPSVAFAGKTAPLEGSGNSQTVIPIDPGANPGEAHDTKVTTPAEKAVVNKVAKQAVAQAERAKAQSDAKAAAREVENMKEIEKKIHNALVAKKLQNSVKFTIDERGLVVTVVTNQVVFAGDRAELLAGGRDILDAVLPPLRGLPNDIQVDGHTNQLNVQTRNYPSGWELSSSRASAVVRYLEARGIAEKRLSASGHADTRPLIDPGDPRSVIMNRRVDIVVLSSLPAAQRELLPSAAK